MMLFIGAIGEDAINYAIKLAQGLRKENIYVETDISDRSIKAQLKYADKMGARYLMILGDDEMKNNKAKLKNMRHRRRKRNRTNYGQIIK